MQIVRFKPNKVRHDVDVIQLQEDLDIQGIKIPNATCFVESITKLRRG